MCLIAYFIRPLDWKESLKATCRGATSVRISVLNDSDQIVRTVDVDDVDAIKDFFDSIEFKKQPVLHSIAAIGNVHLAFFRDDEQLCSIAVIDHDHLRWVDGRWPGDGELTSKSADRIRKWIDDRLRTH